MVRVDGHATPTERFEEHRSRLRAVSYRMLGSLSEADDAVQEAAVVIPCRGRTFWARHGAPILAP